MKKRESKPKHTSSCYCLNCGKEQKWFDYYFEDGTIDEDREPFSEPDFDQWNWISGDSVALIDFEGGFTKGKEWFDALDFCSERCEIKFIKNLLIKSIQNRIRELGGKKKR